MALREQMIRLAHTNVELRPYLLKILKEADASVKEDGGEGKSQVSPFIAELSNLEKGKKNFKSRKTGQPVGWATAYRQGDPSAKAHLEKYIKTQKEIQMKTEKSNAASKKGRPEKQDSSAKRVQRLIDPKPRGRKKKEEKSMFEGGSSVKKKDVNRSFDDKFKKAMIRLAYTNARVREPLLDILREQGYVR